MYQLSLRVSDDNAEEEQQPFEAFLQGPSISDIVAIFSKINDHPTYASDHTIEITQATASDDAKLADLLRQTADIVSPADQ